MAQDRVEAVERALSVLEVFDTPQDSFSLAELADATGFYKSTLLRLLASLERFDYTQRGEDGRWRIGGAPVRLARRHAPSRDLAALIQPLLDGLARQLGDTASLLEVTADVVHCRLAALPDQSLRHDLVPGSQWSLRDTEDPAPALAGGTMVCRRLPLEGRHPLWLALSGPEGRLDTYAAATRLDEAVTLLIGQRDTQGRHA
ncbi:helix-turn-helix domain-containing protein [Halomonas sp. DP5N14-9]|uniref:helix-turn-helix domain-containing protein n=1 Tax=Halomonas sp. DP5N14-9 TaxID=2859075 RepID=UPI001C9A1C7D|nr:helix-turn-helix domain-containing protein [Halomonas sp. DP5N14-9]MBY5941041.1 helix-turn-helix domain-containing protein [Halomonas sp. DP5N14-9]